MAMTSSPAPDAQERFSVALAKEAHALLVDEGHGLMFEDRIAHAAQEAGAPDHIALHVLGYLEDQGLIWRDGRTFKVLPLAVLYEKEFDRKGFRSRNVLRRHALQAAARGFETGEPWVHYWESSDSIPEGESSFTDGPYAEAIWAVRLLEHEGLLELSEYMGRHFRFKITTDGYSLSRDERDLNATLPTSPSEDEAAHAAVAPDALKEVIRSCEQMLDSRGWSAARGELARGDAQYQEGHWGRRRARVLRGAGERSQAPT